MKILIIEDTTNLSEILKEFLENILSDLKLPEPEIKIITTEKEAIQIIVEGGFDLITLDHTLAQGNGEEVLKKIGPSKWSKIIGISLEESFLSFCRQNGIPAMDKMGIAGDKFPVMVKKIMSLS